MIRKKPLSTKRSVKINASKTPGSASPLRTSSPRYGTSEFFASLENQIRRIDQDFIFIWGDESPLTQALNCVRQAIDTILSKRSDAVASPKSNFYSNCLKDAKFEDSSTIDNFKEKQAEYERQKEQLIKKKEKIRREREHLKKNKKTLFELEDELRSVKEELNKEYSALSSNKSKFRAEKERYEVEKAEDAKEKKILNEMKEKISRKESELQVGIENLNREKACLLQEKNELEQEKWVIEQEKKQNSEKLTIINQSRDYINKEMQSLETERDSLLKLKVELKKESSAIKESLAFVEAEKANLIKLETQSKESNLVELFDENKSPSFGAQRLTFEPGEATDYITKNELELIISEILQDFQSVESELLESATELDTRDNALKLKEQLLREKTLELNIIKESLAKSSIELNDILQINLPKLESESEHLEKLIFQLKESQSLMQSQIEMLRQEQLRFDSLKFLQSEEKFSEIQKELETKFSKLAIEENWVKSCTAAIEEKQRILELEEEKMQNLKSEFKADYESKILEIEDAKFNILALQSKLDRQFEKIDEKEKSIINRLSEKRDPIH